MPLILKPSHCLGIVDMFGLSNIIILKKKPNQSTKNYSIFVFDGQLSQVQNHGFVFTTKRQCENNDTNK